MRSASQEIRADGGVQRCERAPPRCRGQFQSGRISGTIVGFWSPGFASAFDIPGYHVHFISAGRQRGGHLLDLEGGRLKARVEDRAESYQCRDRIIKCPSLEALANQGRASVALFRRLAILSSPIVARVLTLALRRHSGWRRAVIRQPCAPHRAV